MNKFNDYLAYLPKQETIQLAFNKANAQQAACFRTINNKCTMLEDFIAGLQKTLYKLQSRISQYSEIGESQKISQLKEKQSQFIINELEEKVKRLTAVEQSLQGELEQKQSMVLELQFKCEQLRNDNAQLKQELIKKSKQIKELIKTNTSARISKITSQQIKPNIITIPTLSQISKQKDQSNDNNDHFMELDAKIKDMQDCLNEEIQSYKRKNIKLEEEVRVLSSQLKQQANNGKKVYELEVKMKNLVYQNKELEEAYTAQLTFNNENEVKFHKKINDLKAQILQMKKSNKNATKQVQKQLRKLSASVLGSNDKSTIFMGATNISEQFAELAKEIIKSKKKQLNQVVLQKDVYIQELKLNIESSKNKIEELNYTLQRTKNARIEKPALANGHNTLNRSSNSKAEIQTKEKEKDKLQSYEKIQSRYEQTISQLKVECQKKEKFIEDIRKRFDEQETKITQQTLELESKLAQKEMEIKYMEQKLSKMESNRLQYENNTKIEKEREINIIKQKMKEIEKQRDELKTKYKEIQQKLWSKQKQIKQLEKKEKLVQEQIKKLEKKIENKSSQYQKTIEKKDETIQQMIFKNQNLNMEIKLLKEKIKISETKQVKTEADPQTPTFSPTMKIKKQLMAEKQQLFAEIQEKNRLIQELKQLKPQIQGKIEIIKRKDEKIDDLTGQIHKLDNEIKLLRSQNEAIKQNIQKLKSNKAEEQSTNFSQLKLEYEKREKLLKAEIQKLNSQSKQFKVQIQQKGKKLKEQIDRLKVQNKKLFEQKAILQEQKLKFDAEKFKSAQKDRKIKTCEQKILQLSAKIQLLEQNIVIPKKQEKKESISSKSISSRFRGTDSIEYAEYGVSTDPIIKKDEGINTVDLFTMQTQQNKVLSRFLDFNEEDLDGNKQSNRSAAKNSSNLFMNLNENVKNVENVDVFEICDSNEEVNVGQSSMNLQIREIFNNLRIQIQKLFNQQEISLAIAKLLPQATQDDFYELMSYIKQKIAQIKVHNQLSFIMAEPGNEPVPIEQDSLDLPQLCRGGSQNDALRKAIQQKDILIHSLMNQRTQQQNTINQLTMQKQQKEEQNENRFMNQCNVYKKEIKQHKKQIDLFQMNFQSMKNIIRNVLEAYSTDEDMEDDFRDSMTMYAKVGKLSEKQRSRINFYIQKYLEIKGIQDVAT